MVSSPARQPASILPERGRDMALTTLLQRFGPEHQEALELLAYRGKALADLAQSFPLLFFALATGGGTARRRRKAIALAEEGALLRDVANAMGLPLALRRIAPEACRRRLPFSVWSGRAGMVLANQIPEEPDRQARWLKAVFFAVRAAGEPFAFWAGAQRELLEFRGLDVRLLRPLAMYVWHSTNTASAVNWLVFSGWTPECSFATAMVETRHWLNRLKLYAHFDGVWLRAPWPMERHFEGYQFEPLIDFWQILEERLDMRNCLDGYAERLLGTPYMLVSIRRNGLRLATLELAMSPSGGHAPYVVQLRGVANTAVSPDLERLVEAWIQWHAGRRIVKPAFQKARAGADRLDDLLGEYWAAVGSPSARTFAVPSFARIELAHERLALRAGLFGWPFSR